MISVIILIRQFRYCYRLTTEGVWYRSSFWSDSSDTVIDLQQRVYDIGHHSDPTVPILLYTYNRGCMIWWYRSSFRSDSSDTVIDLQQRVCDIGHHSDPTVPILLYTYNRGCMIWWYRSSFRSDSSDTVIDFLVLVAFLHVNIQFHILIFVVILLLNCNVIAKIKCDNSSCWQWCAVTQ